MLILRGHEGPVRCVCYATDGRLASAGDDGALRLWNLPGGGEAFRLSGSAGVETLSFAPDGRTLAAGTADGALVLCEAPAAGRVRAQVKAHDRGFPCVAHSPDGQ